MIKPAILLAAIAAGAAILACSKESTEPATYTGTSTFPLSTGSRWEYERNYYRMPYSDSIAADTQTFAIYRRVIGPDTLIGSDQTYIIDDSTSRVDSTVADPFIDRHWYGISDNKLKEFAEITFLPGETPSPNFFALPHIILNFPLINGKLWVSNETSMGFVRNNVVGIEYVTIGQVSIKCDVVRTWLLDESNHMYYDSYWWWCDQGLIQNEIDWGTEYIRDESENIIDSVRVYEEMKLLDMDIQGG